MNSKQFLEPFTYAASLSFQQSAYPAGIQTIPSGWVLVRTATEPAATVGQKPFPDARLRGDSP